MDGGAISLYRDASSGLGDNLVVGVDEDGDIVLAIYMDPAADFSTARVWMVQTEAISNGVTTNPDDPVDLSDSIGVAAGSSLEFNFDSLPSGSNLFGIVGKKAASVPGFEYSKAFQAAANWVWEDGLLRPWISLPGTMVPGNRMAVFQGVAERDRDDIIAYLAAQK